MTLATVTCVKAGVRLSAQLTGADEGAWAARGVTGSRTRESTSSKTARQRRWHAAEMAAAAVGAVADAIWGERIHGSRAQPPSGGSNESTSAGNRSALRRRGVE